MRLTEQRQGLAMLKLRDGLSRWEAAELSQLEAAELLGEVGQRFHQAKPGGMAGGGMSERTFRRWARRFEEEGEDGLLDRRLGRRSGRSVPDSDRNEIERLYRERYQGFTAKHFHEHLVGSHGFSWGYTWTKTHLQNRGLLAKAERRGAHRRRRPRRPLIGMMLHQDASRHAWLSGLAPLDLVVTMDDADNTIYSAILVEEEGTASSLLGLSETIERQGLFCSLYTDRGSHYFHTPEAGGKVAPGVHTQVGRALAQLGVEHIPAYSPEARGRSERMFRTLQDRLPKELALAGITDDIDAANAFIQDVYLPRHNARYAVAPAAGSAFVPVDSAQWRDILCVEARAHGRPRQYGRLERAAPANPQAPGARPLRAGQGARPRISRRRARHFPRPALSCALGSGRSSRRTRNLLRRVPRFRAGASLWTAWTSDARPPRPQDNRNKSGQSMCYINRSTSGARYTRSCLYGSRESNGGYSRRSSTSPSCGAFGLQCSSRPVSRWRARRAPS